MNRKAYLRQQIARIETKRRGIILKTDIRHLTTVERYIYERWSALVDELKDLMFPEKARGRSSDV